MIDLSSSAGVPVSVDPGSGALSLSDELAVEEISLRTLEAARQAYEQAPATAAPLYQMANGITPREKPEPASALRFELTSLRPGAVGGEWVKTVGHIHDAAPDGLGFPEAYEVVAGKAIFVLFKPEPVRCALIEAGRGEQFVIPPGWHHLAVNRGEEAMVFADVVARAVTPDYSLLRERRGAPIYLGPSGIRFNSRYGGCAPVAIRASALPRPSAHGGLAETFFGDRGKLDYLLAPGRYRSAWSDLDAALTGKRP